MSGPVCEHDGCIWLCLGDFAGRTALCSGMRTPAGLSVISLLAESNACLAHVLLFPSRKIGSAVMDAASSQRMNV